MASFIAALAEHMRCPVCSDIFTDPRQLMCPGGSHTVCMRCIDSLVEGSTVQCPVCDEKMPIPESGTSGFRSCAVIVNMLKSMCKSCKMAPGEVTCSHCNRMVCKKCESSHLQYVETRDFMRQLEGSIKDANEKVERMGDLQRALQAQKDADTVCDQLRLELEKKKIELKKQAKKLLEEDEKKREALRQNAENEAAMAQEFMRDMQNKLSAGPSGLSLDELEKIRRDSKAKTLEVQEMFNKAAEETKYVVKVDEEAFAAALESSLGSLSCIKLDSEVKDIPIEICVADSTEEE